jgi:hypothetical protein
VSEDLKPVPWVVFHRITRKAGIINAVSYRRALETAADRLNVSVETLDYSPVYDYETPDQAKARVAGSVG